ncbi:MAG: hypothetical protein ACOYNI_03510 [Acidimicrobiia bacterium]
MARLNDSALPITERVQYAHRVARVLRGLGWFVAAVGVVGMVIFTSLWITGDIDTEQGLSLVLGTLLASVLSGVSAYGSGVNIGLSAERLRLSSDDSTTT